MLTYKITDSNSKVTSLKKPLSVSLISSNDAVADSLTAVFAVYGNTSPLVSVVIENGKNRLFSGIIDTQTEEKTDNGILLTITARSLECILLDNEAMPQTYSMPSMPLIVERHLAPLGFSEYTGDSSAYSGDLPVTKGMSEWAVLEAFCTNFLRTTPRMNVYGVIDISEAENSDTLFISSNKIISQKHILKRNKLYSEISARTYPGGGYEMTRTNDKAVSLKVTRKRFINTIDSNNRTVLSVEDTFQKSNKSYEEYIISVSGCAFCAAGSKIVFDNNTRKIYKLTKAEYVLNSSAEKTVLYLYPMS